MKRLTKMIALLNLILFLNTGASSAENETLQQEWLSSYEAGYTDSAGRYAGGSEITHIAPNKGRLYAGTGYREDSRNPWYGGTSEDDGWAQVLRLDEPDKDWKVVLELGKAH